MSNTDYGAICPYCNEQMLNPATISCTTHTVEYENETLEAIPYENETVAVEYRDTHLCHDCGVKLGEYHHHGCDLEVCPRCDGQLFHCVCDDKVGNYFIEWGSVF